VLLKLSSNVKEGGLVGTVWVKILLL
jgi:hypothetical protein